MGQPATLARLAMLGDYTGDIDLKKSLEPQLPLCGGFFPPANELWVPSSPWMAWWGSDGALIQGTTITNY